MRWSWPAAVAASVATGTLVLAAVGLAASAPSASTVGLALVGGIAGAEWAALGLVVARRARGNVVGALVALVGLGVVFTAAREIAWRVLAHHPETLASLDWLVAVLAESSVWLLAALALLLLYFPDGRVPTDRWRPVPAVLLVAALVHHAYGAVDPAPFRAPLDDLPHPFGPPPAGVSALAALAELALFVSVIVCTAAPVVRFRRAGEARRRQLKWLALAGVGVPAFVVVCLTEVLIFGEAKWLSLAIALATIIGLPLAIGVAMLRADVYDVDKALATTVGYVLVSAVLLVVFAAASFGAGVVLGRDSTVAAAAATALCAVALSPLRRGLQRRVDRQLYPLRQSALAAVGELQRDVHDGRAEPEQLAARLRAALRDPGLRVGYVIPGGAGVVDESGAPFDAAGGAPVNMSGVRIGALLPASRRLSAELLLDVAAACAPLVEIVRLRLQVTAVLREVEASRARLVRVGYDERRRLERDLHDGAQQRLVSLGMALRLAQRHLGDDAVEISDLIDQTVAELATAVAELRRIAHGLRPSALDDGLHAALTALTQHTPIPVGLHVHAEALPDDVANTAYYVTSEAIANAVKHARATRIDVYVARCDGRLELRISDDGRGGAALRSGSGLAGLNDRVQAVGGALALDSRNGHGTVVEAVVPCGS
jgi:signal transduction histidine kinase